MSTAFFLPNAKVMVPPSAGLPVVSLTHTQFPDLDVRGKHLGKWERCLDNLKRFVAARLPL
jgi:hypothetical protein